MLAGLVRTIDHINEWTGRIAAWATLGCVLTCFAVVVLRYGFAIGHPWLQELYVWQHAVVFMVGAGYTLLHRGHVNVDILYGQMSPRRKAWCDIFGTIFFLVPWLAVLTVTATPFITESWRIREISANPDGMPAVYLLKSVIWVFVTLVGLQALAHLIRCALLLAGNPLTDHDEDPVTDERI
ncbi:MAG: TRAP transporter small permease subunit [Rhodobacteraceae bacterium]|nr:TRAP transporter small permease subunit [Paracoccaceae bacterium]